MSTHCNVRKTIVISRGHSSDPTSHSVFHSLRARVLARWLPGTIHCRGRKWTFWILNPPSPAQSSSLNCRFRMRYEAIRTMRRIASTPLHTPSSSRVPSFCPVRLCSLQQRTSSRERESSKLCEDTNPVNHSVMRSIRKREAIANCILTMHYLSYLRPHLIFWFFRNFAWFWWCRNYRNPLLNAHFGILRTLCTYLFRKCDRCKNACNEWYLLFRTLEDTEIQAFQNLSAYANFPYNIHLFWFFRAAFLFTTVVVDRCEIGSVSLPGPRRHWGAGHYPRRLHLCYLNIKIEMRYRVVRNSKIKKKERNRKIISTGSLMKWGS